MTDFLNSVLPAQGVYCTVGIRAGVVKQSFLNTIADVEAVSDGLDNNGIDAYFALASFIEPGSRTVANAAFLRAFFLDLDCGEGKPYVDQPAAAQALAEFLSVTNLPTPTIVNSGGGLHVYWPLTEDVPAETWIIHARSLKRLCTAHGLMADPAVTADAARILRVPGTHNYKNAVSRSVQIMTSGMPTSFDDFIELLPEPPVDLSAARAFGMDAETRDLAGDYPSCSFARIAQKSLKGNGCAQMNRAIREAATLEEPLWRGALSIAKRCIDGETAIHKISKSHPDYTPEATLEKAAETKGPYTCQWYRDNYSDGCAGCTQRVSTPILIGRIVQEAKATEEDTYIVEAPANEMHPAMEIAVPTYPYPYFRGAQGGVFRKVKAADGEPETEVEIYRDDLYITERFFDSDNFGNGDGEMVGINLHMRQDGVRRFYTPVTTIFAKDKLRDALVRNGVVAYGKKLDDLMSYFASSIRKLQTQYSANKTRNQMGWTPDMLGFVVGELEYTPSGTKLAPPASGTRELASMFKPTGTLEEWKSVVNFYDRPGLEPHAFALFMGFGSPLLKLVGGNAVKGAWVHLKSNGSGSGKSTAQMVANSIFGQPDDLLMKKEDTYNSKMHMLGMVNSLLYTVDEITNETPEIISAMAYGFTSGRGKHRMDGQSNKLRINNTTWCNFTLTSANSSVVDILQQLKSTADGELRRVLELSVPTYTEATKVEIDTVFAKLSDNYGLAGPVFIEYVLTHQETVLKMLSDMQAKVDKEFGLDQTDRFYSFLLTCSLTGALIAQRLGLHDIDIKRVYQYLIREVALSRATTKLAVGDPLVVAQEALGAFINENVNNALVAPYTPAGGIPTRPAMMPKGHLKMRYDPDNRELAIPATELRNYLTARQIDVKDAIQHLTQQGYVKFGGKSHPTRLGAGAVGGMTGVPVRCFIFDGDALGIDRDNFAVGTD